MDWTCECDSYDEDYNNVVFMASSIYETRVRVVADMVLYPSIQVLSLIHISEPTRPY